MSMSQTLHSALKALPPDLHQTIYAIKNKVQSPLPLITTSILSTLSSAAQGYIDVETIYGATQPVSLFTLVIADSGERKTSTDKLVAAPLLDHEKQALNFNQELAADFEIERVIWRAKIKRAKAQLSKAIFSEDSRQMQEASDLLVDLHRQEPAPFKTTRSLLSDVTPAALFQALSGDGNSITLHSSDAGNLFSRMNMDFISNVNLIWDGDNITISRKSGDMAITSGRLTLALMLQPAVLQHISDRKEDVLRLSGYFARMLVTAPPSTQGFRFNAGGSEQDSAYLTAFHERLEAILNESVRHQANQSRVTLTFSPEARHYLDRLYSDVESQLRKSGGFSDVRDAGSKILNNATRIAALLHVYQHGISTLVINAEAAKAACELAYYYLLEFASVFGEKTVEQIGQEYGELLLDWIRKNRYDYDRYSLTRTHILQYGPNSLRKKAKLELAIGYLEHQGFIDYYPDGRPAFIQWRARRRSSYSLGF